MPSSLSGNPLAFLRSSGGDVMPSTPTGLGGAPGGGAPGGDDGISDLASMMGGGGDAGDSGAPMPPELMKMMAAQAMAPHVLATQQTEYYKKFLHIIVRLLGDFRREQQVGPRTSADIARAQTQLTAAIAKLDKEKPEEAEPVNSLLAQGMQNKPMMASGAPMGGLPMMR